jgi:small-conductance mechanosensitive channel
VAPHADLDLVRTLALEAVAEADNVLKDPPPLFLFDPGPFPTHYHARVHFPIAERIKQAVARSSVRLLLDQKLKQHRVPLPMSERLLGLPPS